jgi:hypothetical protein
MADDHAIFVASSKPVTPQGRTATLDAAVALVVVYTSNEDQGFRERAVQAVLAKFPGVPIRHLNPRFFDPATAVATAIGVVCRASAHEIIRRYQELTPSAQLIIVADDEADQMTADWYVREMGEPLPPESLTSLPPAVGAAGLGAVGAAASAAGSTDDKTLQHRPSAPAPAATGKR